MGDPRKKTVLYLDEASSESQGEAGLAFLREQYPFVPLERSTLGTVLPEEYRADELSGRWWRDRPGIRG